MLSFAQHARTLASLGLIPGPVQCFAASCPASPASPASSSSGATATGPVSDGGGGGDASSCGGGGFLQPVPMTTTGNADANTTRNSARRTLDRGRVIGDLLVRSCV